MKILINNHNYNTWENLSTYLLNILNKSNLNKNIAANIFCIRVGTNQMWSINSAVNLQYNEDVKLTCPE